MSTDHFEECVDTLRDMMNRTHALRNKADELHAASINVGDSDLTGKLLTRRAELQEDERKEWARVRPALRKLMDDLSGDW